MLSKFKWVVATLYAFTCFQNICYNIFCSQCILMSSANTGNSVTVWCDVTERKNYQSSVIHPKQLYSASNTTSEETLPLKSPVTSRSAGEKVGINTRWDSIKVVVRAHDTTGTPLLHTALERRLMCIQQVLSAHIFKNITLKKSLLN